MSKLSWSSTNHRLLYLVLLLYGFIGTGRQEEAARSWDTFSRLIPTNSVYEHQETNPSPAPNNVDVSPLRTLDENHVMDVSKPEVGKEEHAEVLEENEEETYDDSYEADEELKSSSDESESSRHVDNIEENERKEENSSKARDYAEEDPSTSQYDSYYYYDDYDNSSRARYEPSDSDAVDYPDPGSEEAITDQEPESEEEGESSSTDHASASNENHDAINSLAKPDLELATLAPDKEENNNQTVSMSLDDLDNSSMEGSDKRFSFAGPLATKINSSDDSSILIGEAVVSVVTTKSVVNGTISILPPTSSPMTTEQLMPPSVVLEGKATSTIRPMVTTEDSIILASVQTSRSISGARFLPFPVIDRVEQVDHDEVIESRKTSPPPESTESIIDKLDRVQSELSSGFLAGGFRTAGNTLQLDVLAERERNGRRRFSTTVKTPVISKFVPRRYNDRRLDYTSTTARARLEVTLDTFEELLPRDYEGSSNATTSSPGRSKTGFRWPSKIPSSTLPPETKLTPRITTHTTPHTTAHTIAHATLQPTKIKPNVIVQDLSAFLPPGYKLKKEDVSVTEKSLLNDILTKSNVDISSLLPSGYNKKTPEEIPQTPNNITTTTTKKIETDESPGVETSIQDLFAKSKFDISSLLPRDYTDKKTNITSNNTETQTEKSVNSTIRVQVDGEEKVVPSTAIEATTKKAPSLKIVFPSRPGGRKPIHKITTPQSPRGEGSGSVTPRIQKGWPTRATTEFTGWPTSSTTPISIEKLLEAARTATVSSLNVSLLPTTNLVSSTSTTSTTTTTSRPTTPGICDEECEVAGTIRIIGNATWVPELLDRNTHEWQQLANEVEREMNFVFSKSAVLANWYKRIRIDSFSQGSILVDYFVELKDIQQKVNTLELKVIFHDSLRTYNANRWNETKTKGPMRLGSFAIDPKFTDFVVIPKATTPQYIENDDRLIPQWAIAVIVIGVGGLLFIIVFGVSVLVNRQNGSKLKPTMSTIYDEEVAKNIISAAHATPTNRSADYSKPVHTIWTDPDVSWNDKSFESTSNKMLVDRSYQDNKKYNLYDSWRSEWNGHYYNPSHTSSKYAGYDSTTNLSSRHQPDYDTNF